MPSEAMEAVDALASVVDVYDLASEIGKEFERLIDAHGADSLTNMMPKVRFLNDSTSGHFNCDTDEYNRQPHCQVLCTSCANSENKP
jgi:hypothetical protein